VSAIAPDRSATLRNAEKLLRIGKVAAAIAEYERALREAPQDWDTAIVLAALQARAGNSDAAVERYRGVAAALSSRGDHAKAASLHERILALRPGDEDSLEQLAELCAASGDTTAACAHLQRIVDRRIGRGDLPRAIDALEQAAALVPDVPGAESRLFELCMQSGDLSRARTHISSARDCRSLAVVLQHAGLTADARELLREACHRDPADLGTAAEIARDCLREGDLDGAADFLTAEVIGTDPATRAAAIEVLLAAGRPEAAMALVEATIATWTADGKWDRAIEALEAFVAAVPDHPPLLVKLVEVAVDADRLDVAARGQELLANAYLAHGEIAEGLAIAEDLSDRDPQNTRYGSLLERARLMSADAEAAPVPLRLAR
jgi:tetratricopeptide (TPR) repeat protein